MKALIIKQPYIELILSGKKTWEMRATKTAIRGRIALIEQGTGLIVGEVTLKGNGPEIKDMGAAAATQHLHKVDELHLLQKWRFPWILEDVKRYKTPVPYSHPKGAVIWVNI